MKFQQDFTGDLEQINPFNPQPFAFNRFADGELALLDCLTDTRTADGWKVPKGDNRITFAMRAAIGYSDRHYYLGLSCGCNDQGCQGAKAQSRLLAYAQNTPLERTTFSAIFVNANWKRTMERIEKERWLQKCHVVAPRMFGDVGFPSNVIDPPWGYDYLMGLVNVLQHATKPILVVGGPAACILIHLYWSRVPVERRKTIIDIGSILDPQIHGRPTRGYHHGPNQNRKCQWTPTKSLSEPILS